MSYKSELEKTIEYGLTGGPQIKPDEKRKWLGEFRERVLLGIEIVDAYKMEAEAYVREALKESDAHILILNQKLPMEIVSIYMKMAKELGKEMKVISSESSTAMGIVVASEKAIDKDVVEACIKELPEKFKGSKVLCPNCMEEINKEYQRFSSGFKAQSKLERLFGGKCSACKK